MKAGWGRHAGRFAALLAFVTLGKVFSPQYVIWIVCVRNAPLLAALAVLVVRLVRAPPSGAGVANRPLVSS